MKKSYIALAWALCGALAFNGVALQAAEQKPTEGKLSRIARLKKSFADLKDIYKLRKKSTLENASAEKLLELENKMAKAEKVILGLAGTLGAVGTALVFAGALALGEGAAPAGGVVGGVVAGGTIVSIMALQDKWKGAREKRKEEYLKKAFSENIEPNLDKIVNFEKQLRTVTGAANVASIKQSIKRLQDENARLMGLFINWPSPPRVKVFPMDLIYEGDKSEAEFQLGTRLAKVNQTHRSKYITMVLEEYGKKVDPSSDFYKVLGAALTPAINGIKVNLQNGSIHLFEEPWVWQVVADFYYKTKPTQQQIEQLQNEVEWPKWSEYWKDIERGARRFGIITQNQSLQNMSPQERKQLANKVKDKLLTESRK